MTRDKAPLTPDAGNGAFLRVTSITKAFAAQAVLHDVSFDVAEGQIVCLLGPSGCGKTTLLRIVAGLETADQGQVTLQGQPLDGVPVHQRGFGLMFQDFALFPHKDVVANVAFGLRMQAWPQARIDARVSEMLDLVGLMGYGRRRVYDLSGGEQQRVALARSLAPGPRLLMLDEPLGSLDRALREELMNELRAILTGVGVTTLYVTHDQEEAFALADLVIILNRGRIVQQGPPQAVYLQPASPWGARFLGLSNLLPGRIVALDPPQVQCALGSLPVEIPDPASAGDPVTVLVRPEAARLAADCPEQAGPLLEGVVQECSFRGGHYRLRVRHASGLDLAFQLVSGAAGLPQPGESVALSLRSEAISLLPAEQGIPLPGYVTASAGACPEPSQGKAVSTKERETASSHTNDAHFP